MSFSETIFLFILALVIFGPKKLPEIARQVGKALNEFRRASNEFKAQIEQEISSLEVKQTILPPSPTPAGTASRSLNSAANETSGAPANETKPTGAEADPVAATLAGSAEESVAATINAEPATEALAGSDLPAADLPGADLPASPAPTSNHPTSDLHETEPVISPTAQESHA